VRTTTSGDVQPEQTVGRMERIDHGNESHAIRGSSKGVFFIDLPPNRKGDSQEQLEMGKTPKATAYQTSFVVEDLFVYKNEPIPIRRQTT
jgi:hypothetical protein